MDKTDKIKLAETLSFMERMDKHYTKSQAQAHTQTKLINEGVGKQRIQVSRDEILDMLDKQDTSGQGRFVSVTYVKPIDVLKTKKTWNKPNVDAALANYQGDKEVDWYKSITDFNSDETQLKKNPIAAIVVAQRYVLHWISKDRYNKRYGEYSDKLSNLRMKYGVGIETSGTLGDNHNQRTDSAGQTFNQTGNLSRDFNLADAQLKVTNYVVNETGNIVSEIPNDITKAISSSKKTYSVESAVAQALADNPEALQEYIAARKEITSSFKPQNFLFDRILSIVASVDGVDYYYINDKLITPISKKSEVNVNQGEMVEIAKKQLQLSFNDINASEFAN